MAIISPQRNAILSLESQAERSPIWYSHDVTWIEGDLAHPIGISEGTNSRGPKVLVFGEGLSPNTVNMDEVEWPSWDFAVLLRKPRDGERSDVAPQLNPNSLQTVELLEPTIDELCLSYTGISATYPKLV